MIIWTERFKTMVAAPVHVKDRITVLTILFYGLFGNLHLI
jgi:hypothetical protein